MIGDDIGPMRRKAHEQLRPFAAIQLPADDVGISH